MVLKKIKVAVVDDHQIVIDGISALLNNHHNIVIVATSTSPLDLLNILENLEIDILITDVMMPELNGYELSKKVKQLYPSIKILALSMNGDGQVISDMINDADISGYVMKNISKNELVLAVEKIAEGGIYFTQEILDELNKHNNIKQENTDTHLTNREVEIVKLIEKERSNKQIADSLFISERTVETHRKNIFRKTKTNSIVGLIKYAYHHNLIS
jgi:two-component system, NarL family, nitrate/nitrite response regulator NarL